MLVYSKQYSPVFKRLRHLEHRQANLGILGHPGEDLSDLEFLVREPNSRTLSNRKQPVPDMKKYLPRLESKERIRSHDVKRYCNVNLTRQSSRVPPVTSPPSSTIRLPGIPTPTRKSSISDSTNTTSTSSIPSIEITEPEADEEELIIPFHGGNFSENGKTLFQMSKSSEAGSRNISAAPRPPRSPRPTGTSHMINKRFCRNGRRNVKRSQHFELTLQNIEEVKDMENESSTLGKRGTCSLKGERETVDGPEVVKPVTGHHRSHSTPVDYRELRNKIEATRLVNMGDMSGQFTKHFLSRKGMAEGDLEEDIRNRCISWLKSLDSST